MVSDQGDKTSKGGETRLFSMVKVPRHAIIRLQILTARMPKTKKSRRIKDHGIKNSKQHRGTQRPQELEHIGRRAFQITGTVVFGLSD